MISIHEAFADLDIDYRLPILISWLFQSTRPSQTSTVFLHIGLGDHYISIHEAFADLDETIAKRHIDFIISIHEAFADLDMTLN